MSKAVQIVLIAGTVSLWIALALIIILQVNQFQVVSPQGDTGVSLGYSMRVNFAVPGLLVFTLVLVCVLAFFGRGSEKRSEIEARLLKNY